MAPLRSSLLALVTCGAMAACLTDPTPRAAREGCAGATYPDWATSPYVLPIPVGGTALIDLSNCSGSFHLSGQPDEFAIDFNMAIGTEITASRPGRVVRVEESGRDGGFPNNLVVVDHGDGTFAQYMHLTFGGAVVEVDDDIEWGTLLGYSGATGLAGYPHLHFVVTTGGHAYPYSSEPVTFRNTAPNPNSLLSGRLYQALAY